jgi:hypothetical protein
MLPARLICVTLLDFISSLQTISRFIFVHAVVFYCHSDDAIQQSILFNAQTQNMTNGDYAFFTFDRSQPPQLNLTGITDPADVAYRSRAYYSVKQVIDACKA